MAKLMIALLGAIVVFASIATAFMLRGVVDGDFGNAAVEAAIVAVAITGVPYIWYSVVTKAKMIDLLTSLNDDEASSD